MIFAEKSVFLKRLSLGGGVFLCLLLFFMATISCTTQEPRKVRKGCLDCHPELVEKYAVGIVHQPVKEGQCKKCHRPHGLVGGVYLRTPQPGLCLGCHKQLAEELSGLKGEQLHQPLTKGDCSLCHQPHNAANKFLLEKPAAESCFTCHEISVFNKSFKHQPLLEEGCRSCHNPHGSTLPDLLVEPEKDLCRRCHDLEATRFKDRHGGYAVVSGCLTCHDVHSADNAALLRPVLHQPVSELECQECHLDAAQAEPFALKAAGSALCRDCHETESMARADDTAGHEPVAQGECLNCHSPHASDFRGMTLMATGPLCLSCHEFEQLESGEKGLQKKGSGTLHQPLLEGGCLGCHQAHQAEAGQEKLLRKSADQLCQKCHAEVAKSPQVEHPPAAACHTCHQPHESREAGLLVESQRRLCSGCHDNIMEQFSQKSLHRPFVAGDCSACHTPHGGEHKALLQVPQKDLCQKCHQQLEAERHESFSHKPFKEGNCRLCHRVHSSDEPFLLNGSGEDLCLGCHQEQRPLSAYKVVHQPVAGFNCMACHDGHGQDRKANLLQDQPALCLRCHQIDRDWQAGRAHQPVLAGSCDACHAPHFGKRRGLLHKESVQLCWDCHDSDVESFKKSHQGIGWGRQECLGCHDPHGAPAPGDGLLLPYAHEPFQEKECQACHRGDL